MTSYQQRLVLTCFTRGLRCFSKINKQPFTMNWDFWLQIFCLSCQKHPLESYLFFLTAREAVKIKSAISALCFLHTFLQLQSCRKAGGEGTNNCNPAQLPPKPPRRSHAIASYLAEVSLRPIPLPCSNLPSPGTGAPGTMPPKRAPGINPAELRQPPPRTASTWASQQCVPWKTRCLLLEFHLLIKPEVPSL